MQQTPILVSVAGRSFFFFFLSVSSLQCTAAVTEYAPLGRTRAGRPQGRIGITRAPGAHGHGPWATPRTASH